MQFNLWVTLVVAESADALIARLVRKKVTVGPLGNREIWESGASALLALRLTTEKDQKIEEVVTWVSSILGDLGVPYHNIIVANAPQSSWKVGEIKMPGKSAWSKLKTSCDQE